MTQSTRPSYFLIVLVFAQFAGGILWLSGNAIGAQIETELGIKLGGWLTSSVQIGFIVGTMINAILAIPERILSTKLFLFSAILGAIANFSVILLPINPFNVLFTRFLIGVFLAGIYPIGMKIAADWYGKDLGKAMGYLLGALVLGKAFPYLLKSLDIAINWKTFLILLSSVTIIGGLLLWISLPNKPLPSEKNKFSIHALTAIFNTKPLRNAALGYFGHMWELYAFWTFLPLIWQVYFKNQAGEVSVPLATFLTIVAGFLGCWLGGILALKVGSKKVANYQLFTSGICCFMLPFSMALPLPLFSILLFIWGVTVIGDSPQFSTLVSQHALPSRRGSIITLVTSIGFGVSIISIQLLDWLFNHFSVNPYFFWILCLGPLVGLYFSREDE